MSQCSGAISENASTTIIGFLFEFKSFGVNLCLQWLNYTLDKG